MEIKAFLIRFEKNLISNGFSKDTARHHTLKVAKGLSDSDKKRILAMTEDGQVDVVARSYVARIRRKSEAEAAADNEMANTTTISSNFHGSIAKEATTENEVVKVYKSKEAAPIATATVEHTTTKISTAEYGEDESGATRQFSHVGKITKTETDSTENVKTMKIDVVKIRDGQSDSANAQRDDNGKTKNISKVPVKKDKLSPEAKKEFTSQLLKRSPLFILGFAGAGAGALIVYIAIAALIAAFIALLAGVVVIGAVGTLAGLIYGVIKLFSVMPEGLYEIGVALVIAGSTMVLSICSYNIAVRAIPILWRKFTYFLTDCLNKFKTYIRRIRKECADK